MSGSRQRSSIAARVAAFQSHALIKVSLLYCKQCVSMAPAACAFMRRRAVLLLVSSLPLLSVAAADPHQDMIHAEGISRLCEDLGVEPTDIVLVRDCS
jgi:hypothetical protein